MTEDLSYRATYHIRINWLCFSGDQTTIMSKLCIFESLQLLLSMQNAQVPIKSVVKRALDHSVHVDNHGITRLLPQLFFFHFSPSSADI